MHTHKTCCCHVSGSPPQSNIACGRAVCVCLKVVFFCCCGPELFTFEVLFCFVFFQSLRSISVLKLFGFCHIQRQGFYIDQAPLVLYNLLGALLSFKNCYE